MVAWGVSLLTASLTIPLWLVFLAVLVVIGVAVIAFRRRNESDVPYSPETTSPSVRESDKNADWGSVDPDDLSDFQQQILKLYAKRGGQALSVYELAEFLGKNRLEVDATIEALETEGLVEVYTAKGPKGRTYKLTDPGRDFVIEAGWTA